MIKLHWRLMDALKQYNETCVDGTSNDVKADLGQKVINALNEEINQRRLTEEGFVLQWLLNNLNGNFVWQGQGEINSVPSGIMTECVIDKKQYLDNMEFLSVCNRLYNCLRRKNES